MNKTRPLALLAAAIFTTILLSAAGHPGKDGQRPTLDRVLLDYCDVPMDWQDTGSGFALVFQPDPRGRYRRLQPGDWYLACVGADHVQLRQVNEAPQKYEREDRLYLPIHLIRIVVTHKRGR